MTDIQCGDVVRLKSGGPEMTVEDVNGDSADCVYSDAGNKPQRCTYKTAVLEKVSYEGLGNVIDSLLQLNEE